MYEKYAMLISEEDSAEFSKLLDVVSVDMIEIGSEFEAERERAVKRIEEIISKIDTIGYFKE